MEVKYRVIIPEPVAQKIAGFDKSVRLMLEKYITKHLEGTKEPRTYGKPLRYGLACLWRYRIGDYRLLVEIKDKELIIIAVDFGHRSKIYNQ